MNELAKYRKVGLAWFPLVGRYLWLHWGMRSRRPARDGHRVVATLTTLPSRLGGLRACLRSLLDQTRPPDEVVLALPPRSVREGAGYVVPSWLTGMPVRVLRCERDWGPACKFIPAWQEAAPGTLLLVVDDDNVYPPDFVATLLAWRAKLPGAALGYRGWRLPPDRDWRRTVAWYGSGLREPRQVDVLTGTWGILLERGCLDAAVTAYEGYPEDAFFVDDIWLNGHLARRGVARWLVPAASPPLPTLTQWVNPLGSRENADGLRNNRVIEAFSACW